METDVDCQEPFAESGKRQDSAVRSIHHRAATLDAQGGWIVLESYNDSLFERRKARRHAGLWSTVPAPAPFPIGHKHKEYLSGIRAERRWKERFSIKRDYSRQG